MTTARELMTPDATRVHWAETLVDAAGKMAAVDVGALPICGTVSA
ncbi:MULTISPECIES: hypothetical protein [unclassified Streptomyces]|nr:hypothetical protein [Streptomyces sp. CB02980]